MAAGVFQAISFAVIVLAAACVLFSAYALWLRARNALTRRSWEDREARWTTLTLEAIAGERSADELTGRVGPRERRAFLEFLMRYARRLKGREHDRMRELAGPFLPTVLVLLRSRDPLRRALAVQTLGALGTLEHDDALLRALEDSSPLVSMLAARALAARGGVNHTEPILENIDRFETWGTEYVTSLLVSLGPPASPFLRRVLGDSGRSARVRAVAADALRELHDLEAAQTAFEVLNADPPPDLAAPLLRLLTVLGHPGQLDGIRRTLNHPHFAVRAEAYSAYGALCGEDGAAALEEGLWDRSPWVALHAARAMRDRAWVEPLGRLARSGEPGNHAAGQALSEEPS
jgi:HEAT repeat protein